MISPYFHHCSCLILSVELQFNAKFPNLSAVVCMFCLLLITYDMIRNSNLTFLWVLRHFQWTISLSYMFKIKTFVSGRSDCRIFPSHTKQNAEAQRESKYNSIKCANTFWTWHGTFLTVTFTLLPQLYKQIHNVHLSAKISYKISSSTWMNKYGWFPRCKTTSGFTGNLPHNTRFDGAWWNWVWSVMLYYPQHLSSTSSYYYYFLQWDTRYTVLHIHTHDLVLMGDFNLLIYSSSDAGQLAGI